MTGVQGLQGLRIALVGPMPPPAGGMANQTRQLAELLRGDGALIEFVPTNAAYRPAWVAPWRGLRALFRLLPYLAGLWRAAGRNELMHVMANSGWSWHLFAAPALLIARLRACPAVVNYRGGEAAEFLARSGRVVRLSLRWAARLAVPSGFLQDVFAKHGLKAEIVPNIVDLQRFHPAAERPASLQILVARNLEPIYDNASALRAFARLRQRHPQARLTVAGSGPELSSLRALATELGIEAAVHFAGRVDRDAMAGLYRESHLLLNTSLVDNMPNSLLEALASGVPVVSTAVGGVPYLVRDGQTALLVPAGDPTAMAQAMLRLLDDPALYARLREQGLAEVSRYRWAVVGPQWARLYGDVAAAAAAPGTKRSEGRG